MHAATNEFKNTEEEQWLRMQFLKL